MQKLLSCVFVFGLVVSFVPVSAVGSDDEKILTQREEKKVTENKEEKKKFFGWGEEENKSEEVKEENEKEAEAESDDEERLVTMKEALEKFTPLFETASNNFRDLKMLKIDQMLLKDLEGDFSAFKQFYAEMEIDKDNEEVTIDNFDSMYQLLKQFSATVNLVLLVTINMNSLEQIKEDLKTNTEEQKEIKETIKNIQEQLSELKNVQGGWSAWFWKKLGY